MLAILIFKQHGVGTKSRGFDHLSFNLIHILPKSFLKKHRPICLLYMTTTIYQQKWNYLQGVFRIMSCVRSTQMSPKKKEMSDQERLFYLNWALQSSWSFTNQALLRLKGLLFDSFQTIYVHVCKHTQYSNTNNNEVNPGELKNVYEPDARNRWLFLLDSSGFFRRLFNTYLDTLISAACLIYHIVNQCRTVFN